MTTGKIAKLATPRKQFLRQLLISPCAGTSTLAPDQVIAAQTTRHLALRLGIDRNRHHNRHKARDRQKEGSSSHGLFREFFWGHNENRISRFWNPVYAWQRDGNGVLTLHRLFAINSWATRRESETAFPIALDMRRPVRIAHLTCPSQKQRPGKLPGPCSFRT